MQHKVLARFSLCIISQIGPTRSTAGPAGPVLRLCPVRTALGSLAWHLPQRPGRWAPLAPARCSPGRRGQGAGCGCCTLLAGGSPGPASAVPPSRSAPPCAARPSQRSTVDGVASSSAAGGSSPREAGPRGWRRRCGDPGGSAAAGPPGSGRAPVAAAGG